MNALRAGLCKGAGRGGGGERGGGTRLYLVAEGWKGCRAASPRCARSQPPGVRGACAPAPRLLSLAGRQRATGRPRHGGAGTRQAGSGHRVAAKNCGSACAPGRARRPSAAPRPRSAPAGAPGLRKRRGPERGRGRDTGGELGQGARGCPRALSPRAGPAARGDQQLLLRTLCSLWPLSGASLTPSAIPFPLPSLLPPLSPSLLSFCPPFLPPLSLLCPPFQVPRRILSSLRLPPARFSSLQLAPAFSTSILAPSFQLGGFPQREMRGTSWEMGQWESWGWGRDGGVG